MQPPTVNHVQQSGKFTGRLRRLARLSLLLAWFVVLAVLTVVLQSKIPQPWSGLVYLVAMPAAILPAKRSFGRGRSDRENHSKI
ncbi:hypothetical protein ACWDA7_19880 [Streptomyces sp. NPDC001156]